MDKLCVSGMHAAYPPLLRVRRVACLAVPVSLKRQRLRLLQLASHAYVMCAQATADVASKAGASLTEGGNGPTGMLESDQRSHPFSFCRQIMP